MQGEQENASAGAAQGGLGAGLVRILWYFDEGLRRIEAVILSVGILLMAANAVANVIGRTFLGSSIYFSEELNQFLIVLVTFVGLGYAARHGRHIRMSAIYDQLGHRKRKALMILIAGVTSAIMFLLAWYAVSYVDRVAMMGQVTPALRVPVYLTYLWVPLGLAITGIQYALTVVRNLQSEDIYISFSHVDTYDDPEEHMERVE
jgi:TRAP-type C4-dicarboxylate transport system permease small subunit